MLKLFLKCFHIEIDNEHWYQLLYKKLNQIKLASVFITILLSSYIEFT